MLLCHPPLFFLHPEVLVVRNRQRFKRNCDNVVMFTEEDDHYKPWVGCQSYKDGGSAKDKDGGSAKERVRCPCWIHACCNGWFPKTSMEVAAMPPWCCKKHRKIEIEELEAKHREEIAARRPKKIAKRKKSSTAGKKTARK